MSLVHQERERLNAIMRDIDKWNTLTEAERGELLHQGKWDVYNKIAGMLTPEEGRVLQTHKDALFVTLRQAFTECMDHGSPVSEVKMVTELLFRVVRRLHGN